MTSTTQSFEPDFQFVNLNSQSSTGEQDDRTSAKSTASATVALGYLITSDTMGLRLEEFGGSVTALRATAQLPASYGSAKST